MQEWRDTQEPEGAEEIDNEEHNTYDTVIVGILERLKRYLPKEICNNHFCGDESPLLVAY